MSAKNYEIHLTQAKVDNNENAGVFFEAHCMQCTVFEAHCMHCYLSCFHASGWATRRSPNL